MGAFRLDGSQDQATGVPAGQFQPTNWNSLGSTSTVVCSTTATAKVFMIPATELCHEYLRVVFTDASAAAALGTFNVRLKSDGL